MKRTYIFMLLSLLLFTGCSQEKADALLTVAKSYESKSLAAIDAYEELFKDSVYVEKKSNDEIFNQTSSVIKKYGKDKVTFQNLVDEISSRNDKLLDKKIEMEFNKLRVIYEKIRKTYESLPQGSITAVKYVSCAQDIVAKSMIQLTNFSTIIDKTPLYSDNIKKDFASYKNMIVKKEDDKAKILLEKIANNINSYDEKYENALKLTLLAVKEGKVLHELLGSYKDITISDILSVTQSGFDFISTINKTDINKIKEGLTAFETQFSSEEYWQRVGNIPVFEIESCK